jgi:ketosteroid isomerase-like protein
LIGGGIAAIALAAIACHGDAANPSDWVAPTVRAAIDVANAQHQAAMLRQDAAAVAALYAEDVTSPTATEIIRGRDAKRRQTEARFGDGTVVARYDSTDLVRPLGEGYALEIGRWSATVADSAGRTATSQGRYLVVWRRDPDGAWRVLSDIGNVAPTAP